MLTPAEAKGSSLPSGMIANSGEEHQQEGREELVEWIRNLGAEWATVNELQKMLHGEEDPQVCAVVAQVLEEKAAAAGRIRKVRAPPACEVSGRCSGGDGGGGG